MIRIVIADDSPIFLGGIHLMIAKQKELRLAAEACDGKELLQLVKQEKPDIVITDIEMPVMNGIEATKILKAEFPAIGILALTMYGEDHFIKDMLEAGADGYLLKNASKEEVLTAVKAVYEGHNYFCNATTPRMAKMISHANMLSKQPKVEFTEKETDIIRLICEQYGSKEIADKTSLTYRTVEKYRAIILEKTQSKNMAGVVVYAIRHGLFVV
jgi:DNA-binding NarL/FixJ family response regulator